MSGNGKVKKIYPLTPLQEGMLYHNLMDSGDTSYHLQTCFWANKVIDLEKVKQSLSLLSQKHETLKTAFVTPKTTGKTWQVIVADRNIELNYEEKIGADEAAYAEMLKEADLKRGFNLQKDSIIRLSIMKFAEERYLFMFSSHHIIMDGWCMSMIFGDFVAFYDALLKGISFEELKDTVEKDRYKTATYKEYIDWLGAQDKESGLLYWENLLGDYEEQAEIKPMKQPAPCDIQMERLRRTISKDVSDKLESLANEYKITMSNILEAAWGILLQRYNHTNDVVYGKVVSGRDANIKGIEKIVGLFINTIPVRIKSDGQQSVKDLLKSVWEQAAKSNDYEYCSLAEIQEKTLLGSKLISTIFTFENYYAGDSNNRPTDDVLGIEMESAREQTSYAVSISSSYDGTNIHCDILFNPNEYLPEEIEIILGCLEKILTEMSINPEKKVCELDAVTDREKELIFGEFNNTDLEYDKTKTIVDLLKGEVLANPYHIALSWQGRKITYKEFDEMTDVLALKLVNVGIKPNDYVALMCDRGIEMIASIYGVIKAGGAYVPISPTFPKDRIEYMLEDCKPKALLVTDVEYAKGLDLPVVDVSKDTIWSGERKEIHVDIAPNNLAYLIYTSGTTGKPKGVMVEHHGVVAMREYLKKVYEVTVNDCVLQFANYIFDASVYEMTMALLNGATLSLVSQEIIEDIPAFNQFIEEENISISVLPPQFCIQINPQSIRVLTTAGSSANGELIKKTGDRYINAYGPTENTVVATHWEYERGTDIPKNIPIGKPVCNTKIYMLDGERICGIGMPGELCITGDGVARGYLNREELNREKFVKNPFGAGVMYRSGDLAKWQPDGNIEFLGRIDEQVKIRGFRIELGEIENVIRTADEIVDVAVITRESHGGEKEIYAYYTAERSVSGDEIKTYLRKSLPEYMIPSYMMQIEKIPVTRNGKLNKRELPEIDNVSGRDIILPRTETEEIIHKLFCEILERQQISVRDNFFDIGGHSLRATRLVNRIEAETGKKVALKEIFANPTVEQIAQFINGEKIEEYQPIPKAEEKEFYPMSPAQRRMFILSLVSDNQIVYNMPQCFKVEGKLDAERMKAAFEEMVNRHEILRTGFLMDGEKAVQKVYRSVSLDFEVIDQEEEDVIGQVKKFIKPFDLASGNVIRMRIINGTDHAVWFFDMHHIVGDGMSMGTFMDELFAVYNGKTLEPLLCQYKDYSEWMELRSLEDQKQYWVKEFEDVPEVLNMPLDYKRPVNQQYEGARIHRLFSHDILEEVKKLTKDTDTTEYMVFLSAVMILLSKYARQEDIVVGSPVSGRIHKDTEKMLGVFINTLAMRGKPEGKKTYVEFLDEIKNTCLKAFDNQEFPFEELVECIDINRDVSRNPLFDTMLVFQNNESVQSNMETGTLAQMEVDFAIAKFDLTFSICEIAGKYQVSLEYCKNIFKTDTIENLLNHLEYILTQIVKNPRLLLEDIETVTDEEKIDIISKFNQTYQEYNSEITVAELFENQVHRTPDKIAVRFEDQSITYGELNNKANAVANKLRQLGVKPNDYVAVLSKRSIEMIAAVYGVIKSGAAYVPMDVTYPKERIEYMISDCNPVAAVVYGADIEIDAPVIDMAQLEEADINNLAIVNKPDDALYVIYTSGTTGNPKGVIVHNRGVVNLRNYFLNSLHVNSDDVVLQFANLIFDGSVWEMTMGLLTGASLVVANDLQREDAEEFSNLARDTNVTISALPPVFYVNVRDFKPRILITAGSEASHDMVQQVIHDSEYVNSYGPSECTVAATHWKCSKGEEVPYRVPIGHPITNVQVYIMEHGRLCGFGVPGEICIAGDGVALGYINQPELTNEKFISNPFGEGKLYRTGDLGRWTCDGNIEFLGRMDEQVKIRGFRVELGEIESAIRNIADISDVAVITREQNGEKEIYAYYVSEGRLTPNKIKDELNRSLPAYMIPAGIMELHEIPLTKNGKLNKKELPIIEVMSENEYIAPSNKVEEMLCEAFKEVLLTNKVGVKDSFFELGGDSIKAIRVVSRVRDEGYTIAVRDIMKYHTVQEIAKACVVAVENHYEQGEVNGKILLTPIVKQFNEWCLKKPSHFNQATMIKVKLESDKDIKSAISAIVTHHDMLRAVYRDSKLEVLSVDESRLFDYESFDIIGMEHPESFVEEKCTEIQQSIDLKNGPLVKVAFFRTDYGNYMMIAIHHLVIDGVSFRIVLEDFETAQECIIKGEEIHLKKKTASYKEWAEALNDYKQLNANSFEKVHWSVVSMEVDEAGVEADVEGESSESGFASLGLALDKEMTKALQKETNHAFYTEINDILLAALGAAVRTITGQKMVAVGLEGHGREPIHKEILIDRTVGWFTSSYPIVIKPRTDMKKNIVETKEVLRKVPNKGLGYGLFADAKKTPDIFFNYLGQLGDESDEEMRFSVGLSSAKENHFAGGINFNGSISHGRLAFAITYDVTKYSEGMMTKLAECYKQCLEDIILFCKERETPEKTPSDYSASDLSKYELRYIMENTEGVDDIYSLTGLQQGMFFHHEMDTESTSYVLQNVYSLIGEVEVEAVRNAMRLLIVKHDVLRTAIFNGVGVQPRQAVLTNQELDFKQFDIEDKTPEEQELFTQECINQDLHHGFDFEQEPLMRVTYIRQSNVAHKMIWSFHHIIMDGWCLPIVFGDFMKYYELLTQGTAFDSLLEEITQEKSESNGYGAYLSWLEAQYKDRALAYWEDLLLDYEEPAGIKPMAKPEPTESQMERIRVTWKKELSERIIDTAQRLKVTLNTVLEVAWGLTLSAYNNMDDVVFGKVISGRDADVEGIESIVGLFANTIPVRVKYNTDTTIEDLIRNLQMQAGKSSEFGYCALPDIQNHTIVGSELIKTLFVFENYYVDEENIKPRENGLQIQVDTAREETNYSLTVSMSNSGTNINCDIMYNPNEFTGDEINSIISRIEVILKNMTKDVKQKTNLLESITDDERRLIMDVFNDTYNDYPRHKSIAEVLEEQAQLTPDRTAVVYDDGVNEKRKLTYKKLMNRTNSLAYILKCQGIGRDDCVAVMAEKSIEMIAGICGILKAGGAYVPIDATYPEDRIRFMLDDCKPKIILTYGLSEAVNQLLEESSITIINLEDKAVWKHTENVVTDADGDSLAYIIYTSGTTGKPKGTMIENKSVLRLVMKPNYINFSEKTSILQTGSMSFDASTFEVWGSLLNGGKLVLTDREILLDSQKMKRCILKNGINTMWLTSTLYNQMISTDQSMFDDLDELLIGGEKLSDEHVHMLKSRLNNVRLTNGYGPTENTTFTTTYEIPEEFVSIPIGKNVSNTEIYILQGDKLCGIGVPGELCTGGDGLSRGYLNRPELTKKKFVIGPNGVRLYRSGDLARWLPDGNIEYMGRIDTQVKIRGFRIETEEIASVIRKQNGIKDAVVVVRMDGAGEKYICAYYTSDQYIDIKDLKKHLREEMPDYMVPSHYMQIEAVPVTRNGKLNERKLPAIDLTYGLQYVAPRNDMEEAIAAIFAEILGLEKVSVTDNFFDIGGHSLRAIRLANMIEQQLKRKLLFQDIFKNPTVELLSELVLSLEEDKYEPIPNAPYKEYYKMSSSQKRTFLLYQIDEANTVYNMPQSIKLTGNVDIEALRATFDTMISRHEILRTAFRMIDGEAVQVIYDSVEPDFEVINAEGMDESETVKLMSEFIKPFDITNAQTVRMRIVCCGDYTLMFFDMHHIVGDGMSMGIFMEEFNKLYNGGTLKILTHQYKDYSEWMNARSLDAQRDYWISQFEDEIPVLDMPLDRKRPQHQSYEGAAAYGVIEKKIADKIKELARQNEATEYMVLLSAAMVLLSKYSRQEDIVLGSPIAGRTHKDTESMLGMFVNTLAFRGKPEKTKTFHEFLMEMKDVCLKAYENQEYPFEELVEAIDAHKDMSRNPLFDMMFILQNNEKSSLNLGDTEASGMGLEFKTSKFDISFNVYESDNGYFLALEYCTAIFNHETILRLLEHYNIVLQQIVSNPSMLIEDIAVLTQTEADCISQRFNQSKYEYDDNQTIMQILERQAGKTPDKVAVLFEDTALTYKEFNEKVNVLANKLRDRGVKQNDYIVIIADRSIEMLAGIYGILKAGGAYVPVDKEYPIERIRYILEDCQSKAILTYNAQDIIAELNIQNNAIPVYDLSDEELWKGNTSNPSRINLAADNSYVIYTSGTTGQPKGVMIKHQSMINLLEWMQKQYMLTVDDVILLKTTYTFDVSVSELFWWPICGGSIAILKPEAQKDPELIIQAIEKYKVSLVDFVPTMLSAFLADIKNKPDTEKRMSSLKYVIAAGEALPLSLVNEFYEVSASQTKLLNLYGPTEACVYASYYDCDRGISEVLIGKPVGNTRLYIADKNKLCGIGVPGELCIAGDGLAYGYLNNRELTDVKFVDNPFGDGMMYRSGDLARWRADGNIEYMGRMDEQVKIRGFRIEVGEIENALRSIKNVTDVAVIVKEDISGERAVYAYLTSETVLDINQVRQEVRLHLPDYMVPSYFMQIDEIPFTRNGKLDRRNLPDITNRSTSEYIAPENDIQRALCDVFSGVLGVQIGIKEGFFEMGGDSIKAIRCVSKLREVGYDVSIKEIMQRQTVEAISYVTKLAKANEYEQGVVTGTVLPTSMVHMFNSWELVNKNHFNQAMMIPVFDATKEEIRKVLTAIATHHDALRIVYQNDRMLIRGVENEELFYFEEHDFTRTELSAEDIAKEIDAIATRIQSGMDIQRGPLLRTGWFATPNGNYLLMSIHHLAVDGVSWRIILEDLNTCLRQIKSSDKLVLPEKTASIIDWTNALEEYKTTKQLQAEAEYWNKVTGDMESGRFGNDLEKADDRYQYETVTLSLSETVTKRLLLNSQKAFNTEVNDILLSALSLAAREVTGQKSLTVVLEGHGREEIHKEILIDRTVGWFTSMYPVVIKSKRSFRETVIDTKDMLRRVPNHGLGYGLLHTPKALDADIYFNYLGEMKAQKKTDNSVSYSTGLNIAVDNRLPGNINFNGSVLDDRLYFAITYDVQLYSKEKMQALADAYEKKLNAVIKYCASRQTSEKTVTDYTGSILTNDELENINEIYGAVEDIYPLTGLQEGMLFYNLQAQYSTSYVVQSLYNLRGDLKPEYVEKALELLVRRHDVLRTAIVYHGVTRPYQVILGERLAEYKELDVSDMQEAEQEAAVEETVSSDLNRGFDLEKDSLARMTLIKRGDNWYQLIWNIHHIVMDGWCLSMMFGDFLQYYYKLNDGNAFDALMEQVSVENKNAPKFSMYMKWLEKQDKEEGLTYWRELLDGYENSARIEPMGSQEPSEKQMERIATVLSKDVTKELNAIAVKNKVTMNTVAECLWGLVLQNYNNSDDVVFGKVVSGRNADIKGIENMVGLFANTIPVRCTKKEGMSFDTLLKDMQLAANTAGNYDYCTLSDIQNQSELGQELIKTLFVFENYYVDAEKLQAKDEKLQITVESAREQTNYALTISANYNGEALGFDIMYNPNEYGTYDIQNILERIEFVAKEVVLNKEQNLDAISYITKKEMEIIQYEFNRTNAARSNKTIIDLFEQQVEKTPDNVAVVMGDVKLTYSEFNAKVNALANVLRDMGIKPNDYVALIAKRSIEMVLGIFAIVKSGAAYVPIDPAYPKERIEYMLEDCKPKAVLTYGYTLDNSSIPVIDLSEKDVFEGNTNNPEHIVKKDDMIYVIYTSGTTGQPKGVLNMHKGLVNLLQWMQKTYPLNEKDVMMFKTTYIFDVSVSEIFWWSITGAALAILEPEAHKDPYLIAEAVYKHQVTHIDFAPAMLSMFIVSLEKDAEAVNQLKSIRYVISAGEALNVEVVNKFYNMLPAAQVKLANLYGPTESTIYVTYYDCHENMSKVPIGKPIANTNMYIVNHGKMCGIGVIGELCIAGVGLARGYLHKEELTEEKFIDNPFAPGKMYRSGDLARWLPDGNIEYYGRMDDQIKIRGFRIELGDIESVIRKVEDITDVAMLVKTLQNGEKVICTYFTSDKKVDIKEEFKDKLLQKLPGYMVPQYMMQIDNIPVTSNGKLDRRALPEIKMDNSTKYVEPRNHIEKKLCEIYQEVLGVERVGIDDNIFDLGGNSLTIIRIVGNAMVEGINITIQNVFMNPTIRALYDYMQKADQQMEALNAEDYVKYNELLAVKPVTEDVKIENRHLGNVLITGSTGFLGVHIVAALLNGSADKIYCMIRCDNEEHGYQRLKSTFNYFFEGQYEDLFGEKIIVVPGNMTDVDLKEKMPQDVNTIIHSAANTKHFGFYSEFYNINVNGTKNLIAYAKKTGASMTYVSTLSVCDLLNEDADRTEFTECDYYMNQILESPYMRSKFEAEAAVYDAIMDGLDAIVIRTGMLTNRSSDLRTMKDYRSNSFLNSMKSLVKMGTVSESVTHMDIKISPIDEIAEGVIALSCNRADEYHVFHLYHERRIQFEAFRKVFAENGYPVTVVSDQEFGAVVSGNMKSMDSDDLYEIVATSHVEQSAKRSEVKNEITSGLLSRIGFTWSSFDEEFIRNWILYYKELNYWNE